MTRIKPCRLITIPISHYCEKARWALNRAGVPYVEEKHLQGFHYIYSNRYARSATVPILVTETELLRESSDIMEWADEKMSASDKIYPEEMSLRNSVKQFVRDLDEGLGPDGRLWMYSYMFEHVDVLLRYSKDHGVPAHEIRLLPLIFPLLRPFAGRRMQLGPTSQQGTKVRVDEVFDRVGARLRGGQRFLFGEKFSAADLTFAALSAAVLLPDGYGVKLPTLSDIPPEMASQVAIWRAHPAGRFALRIYDEQRFKR